MVSTVPGSGGAGVPLPENRKKYAPAPPATRSTARIRISFFLPPLAGSSSSPASVFLSLMGDLLLVRGLQAGEQGVRLGGGGGEDDDVDPAVQRDGVRIRHGYQRPGRGVAVGRHPRLRDAVAGEIADDGRRAEGRQLP